MSTFGANVRPGRVFSVFVSVLVFMFDSSLGSDRDLPRLDLGPRRNAHRQHAVLAARDRQRRIDVARQLDRARELARETLAAVVRALCGRLLRALAADRESLTATLDRQVLGREARNLDANHDVAVLPEEIHRRVHAATQETPVEPTRALKHAL